MSDAPLSLLHAVRRWLNDGSDCEAVVHGDHRLSYRALAAHALALAEDLRARGIQPGDRVAVLFTPRPEALVTLLATWLAGATWLGINPRFKRPEQRQNLADSGAKLLIAMETVGKTDLRADLDAHAAELGIGVMRVGAGLWQGDLPPPVDESSVPEMWDAVLAAFDPTVPAVIIFTSGSTGRPKGALITHQGLAFRSHTLQRDRFNIPHVRQVLDLPVNHIGALASGIGVAFSAGGALVLNEQFDPGFTLRAIGAEGLQVLSGVPAMLDRIVAHPDFTSADLTPLRYVSWGAGPINPRVLAALMERTGADFSQQYGQTESNGPICYTPPTRDVEILLNTTGKPDPALSLRIAEDDGTPVAPGDEGEVQVLHPHPFAGYLGNPEASAEAFTADGWLRTGDRAKLRADGYLVFCGRSKEMYKSGGFNVYPREVEITIEEHPAIRSAAVIGVEDPEWGQVGHAFVEGDPVDPDALIAWCRERLANYKLPKHVTWMQKLPRTPVDKVDRMALTSRAQNPRVDASQEASTSSDPSLCG